MVELQLYQVLSMNEHSPAPKKLSLLVNTQIVTLNIILNANLKVTQETQKRVLSLT